jgi:hypothetical protein
MAMAMIWLSTVWPERGPTCQRRASTARPSSIAPRMLPSSSSVRLARATRGCLNSGTPLANASTPVSALQPAENALSSSRTLTVSSAGVGMSEWPGCGACRTRGWIRPMTMMASRPTMKTIVGSRNALAGWPPVCHGRTLDHQRRLVGRGETQHGAGHRGRRADPRLKCPEPDGNV